jgi:hypothetical protein
VRWRLARKDLIFILIVLGVGLLVVAVILMAPQVLPIPPDVNHFINP